MSFIRDDYERQEIRGRAHYNVTASAHRAGGQARMGEEGISIGMRGLPAPPTRKPMDSAFTPAELKAQQRHKIEEIRLALVVAGARALDQQAQLLGLSRSTTWSILKANYKSSGLSAGIINRILASPRLPPRVRHQILEYIHERLAGV